MLLTFIILSIISLLISFSLTPLTIKWAKKYRLVDDIARRPHPAHTHLGSIPRGGGVPIFLGIFLPIIFLLKINLQLIGIFIGSLILILVGLWDDKRDRSPYIRFLFNCLAALAVILSGINIPYITNPLGGILHFDKINLTFDVLGIDLTISAAHFFALLWIVWTTNIVGWSGGVDGQLPGFVAISAIIIGILSLRYIADPSQHYVTALSFITAGAFLGFLPWNYYPQKIMPGYGGKILAGFLLAILGILSYGKMGTALLVLGVPTMDAVYTLLRRLGSKKSPVWADRGHLHHRLLDLGWGKRRVALFYWGVSAILGAVALTVRSQEKLFAFLLVAVALAGFLVWLKYFSQLSKPQDPDSG